MARFTARYVKHGGGTRRQATKLATKVVRQKAYKYWPKRRIAKFWRLAHTACKRQKAANARQVSTMASRKSNVIPTTTRISRSKRTKLVSTVAHHVLCTIGNPASSVGITKGYFTGGLAIGGAWFYRNYATPGYTVVTATTAGVGNASSFLRAYRLAWRAAKGA